MPKPTLVPLRSPGIVDDADLLSIEELKELRQPVPGKRPGIYFLFNGDELVYVGISFLNVLSRIGTHINTKTFDSFVIFDENDAERLEQLEADYVFKFAPRYNAVTPNGGRYYTKKGLAQLSGLPGRTLNRLLKEWRLQPDPNGRYDVQEFQRLLQKARSGSTQ